MLRIKALGATVLMVGLLTGCSSGPFAGCERGQSEPDKALLAFLSAAHSGDESAAQQSLKPGFLVDDELFERLHEAVQSDDFESLKLTNADRASTAYFFTALSGQGKLIGNFEVHELEDKCYAVAWGTWEEPGEQT